MSVYVDKPAYKYGRMIMCHMVADTLDELHAMADQIGVSRRWFQDGKRPHYDICKARRKLAVKLGAVEVSPKDIIKVLRGGTQ